MIKISKYITLREEELIFSYIRSAGPGGQNVNKVATAVQLHFDINQSTSLPVDVKNRLLNLAGRRVNQEGILVIEAKRYRTQGQNRADATQRLKALIQKATQLPKKRYKTHPPRSSKEKRLHSKKQRGETKHLRHEKINPRD
jgi:ribosome-associated protein